MMIDGEVLLYLLSYIWSSSSITNITLAKKLLQRQEIDNHMISSKKYGSSRKGSAIVLSQLSLCMDCETISNSDSDVNTCSCCSNGCTCMGSSCKCNSSCTCSSCTVLKSSSNVDVCTCIGSSSREGKICAIHH